MNQEKHDRADGLKESILLMNERIKRLNCLRKNQGAHQDYKLSISQRNGGNIVVIPDYLVEVSLLQMEGALTAELKKLEKEYLEL